MPANLATTPIEEELVNEAAVDADGGVVVADVTLGIAVSAGQRNAVVDVEDTVGTARRPDNRGIVNDIFLGVGVANLEVGVVRAAEGGPGVGQVVGILGEEVGGVEAGSNGAVKLDEAVVGGSDNAQLEARRVAERQVELAVLGGITRRGVGANFGVELVEAKSDVGLVRRDEGRDRSLRAASSGVGGLNDFNLSKLVGFSVVGIST